jgi:hypothetical protein
MSTPDKATDTTLVNRAGVDYRITLDKMSTLQDTDLLLVNRAGVDYRCAAKDVKAALGGAAGADDVGQLAIAGMDNIVAGPDGSLLAWFQADATSDTGSGARHINPIFSAVKWKGEGWKVLTVVPGGDSLIWPTPGSAFVNFLGKQLITFSGAANVIAETHPYVVSPGDVFFARKPSPMNNPHSNLRSICNGPAGAIAVLESSGTERIYRSVDSFASASELPPSITENGRSNVCIYLPKSGIYLVHGLTQSNHFYSTNGTNWAKGGNPSAARNGDFNATFAENQDGSIIMSLAQAGGTGSFGSFYSVDKGVNWSWSSSGFTSHYSSRYMGPWFINGKFRVLTRQGAAPTAVGPIRIMSSVDGVTWTEGPDLTSTFAAFTPKWSTTGTQSATDGHDAYIAGERSDGAPGITIIPNKDFT